MLKRILSVIITVLGAAVGYGAFLLSKYWLLTSGVDLDKTLTAFQQAVLGIFFAIIFSLVFFNLTPVIRRQGAKVADNIEHDLQGVSANDIVLSVVGLIVGLILAALIAPLFATVTNRYVYTVIVVILYGVFGFLGAVIGNKKGKEFLLQLMSVKRNEPKEESRLSFIKSKKKMDGIPKILDTSVIIDGRIAEIMKTGFIEGPIVIPEFVLVELRHIADSSDSLKRTRGRRGLDILNKIQDDYGIEIYNTDSEKSLKDIPEVDVKLLKLAQNMGGKVVTNDYNLNKVAGINEIGVLNINELANTLKPVVIPGEEMTVTLVKQGKTLAQAVAYLDDGTMIVVEDGRKYIGQTLEVVVTSVLQTAAGRMIFARVKKA